MFMFGCLPGVLVIGLAKDIGIDMVNLTPVVAANAVGLIALFNAGGRLAWGTLSDKFGRVRVVTMMFATRSYSVTADYIKIHLVGGSFSVLMNEIESINRINWLSTVTGFRFGFGGFGEYFGLFYFSKLGKVTAFVTNRNDLVLIERRDGKKLLISPERPDEFVDFVRNAREQQT